MISNYTKKLVDNLPKEFKNKKKTVKLDLVLDGGVFNGSYLFGALYFLKEMERRKYMKVERISSSSVGSIAGLFYFIDCLDYYQYLYKITISEIKKTMNIKIVSINKVKAK
jgi:predicted acylesterase/phospholipase RssA